MRCTCWSPSAVVQFFTSSLTSKSLALAGSIEASLAGAVILAVGSGFGSSDAAISSTTGAGGGGGVGGSGLGAGLATGEGDGVGAALTDDTRAGPLASGSGPQAATTNGAARAAITREFQTIRFMARSVPSEPPTTQEAPLLPRPDVGPLPRLLPTCHRALRPRHPGG